MQLKNVVKLIIASPALIAISILAAGLPAKAEAADWMCRGTIRRAHSDNVRFSVPWTPNAGFEQRIKFRNDRTGSNMPHSSRLRYDRRNDKGQRIYRGNVNGMADVTLIHLSRSSNPRPGGEVSVNFDGQWGRGTCNRR